MKHWLYAHRTVSGDPRRLATMLLEQSAALLAGTSGQPTAVAGDGSFTLAVPANVAGIHLSKQVRAVTGVARHEDDRVVLPLRWHAEPGKRLFPTFEGAIELQPLAADWAQLSVVGASQIPLGPLGAAVDATVLRTVVQQTAEELVDRLAQRLPAAGTPISTNPAPRLGRPLRVRDVMTEDPLMLSEETSLRSAAFLLFHMEVSGAPVVDAAGDLIGVLSEADLLAKEASYRFGLGRKAGTEQQRRTARTVGQACSRPALVTAADAELREAARYMLDSEVSRLVVLDAGEVAGIVTRHDVLAALVRTDAEILAAVRTTLASVGADEVQAQVEWGDVTLTGRVGTRSLADRIAHELVEVDGVIWVNDGALSWEVDDTLTPSLYGPM